jgi:hypothetical protein
MAGEVPTGVFPLDFPGVQIDPLAQCCVDEVEVSIVPLKACECFDECFDIGYTYQDQCPSVEIGKRLDSCVLPLVALDRDKTRKIAYWGQNDDTVRNADIVLVPAKYRNDPLVGEFGNGGFDPETGVPLPGTLEELARDTHAKYGHVGFDVPPSVGCRNIWMDLVYIDEIICKGVHLTTEEYEFFDSECACVVVANTLEISDFVTDVCLPRILPDDGFQLTGYSPLPVDYPEAINFEYCGLPRLDRFEEKENAFFKFRRETPACARADQGYFVRVEITAKQLPLMLQWTDILPVGDGHTLLSGKLTDTLVFTVVGETLVREYVVKTSATAVDAAITGSAQVVAQPLTLLNLTSDTTIIDPNCPTLCFTQFGSQNPNVFGKVFWAGGGRFDPVPPPDIGLWVSVYAGQGSAGKSAREHFLTASTTVPNAAASHAFSVPPSAFNGLAVGLPVWVFNSCFEDNPSRRIVLLDIEKEEAKPNPDEEIVGLYGEITALNTIAGTVTVTFYNAPNQSVDLTTAAKATIMVSPNNAKGFYWEASPKLVGLCGDPVGPSGNPCILRWGYRFWNSTQNPAPCALGAGFICDGNGESFQYEFHGDLVKDIINPVDWIDLWASPMIEVILKVNAEAADTSIEVCDICIFEPCDIIQIVDSSCTGREGGGPGFVTSVVSTAPLNVLENCDDLNAVTGNILLGVPIPLNIPECPGEGFDGFDTARKARVFRKPDIARYAFSVTTSCDDNGCPSVCGLPAEQSVCVDFETGKFTFDDNVFLRNPLICYRTLDVVIDIPLIGGIYFLRAIDQCGCVSPPSKPIRMIDPNPPPAPPAPFVRDEISGSFGFGVGAHVPVPGMLIGFSLSSAKDVVIETNIAQDNFSELAVLIDGITLVGLSGMAFHTFAGGVGSFVTMVHGSATIPLGVGAHTAQLMARGATVIPGSVGLGCTVWATPALPLELRAKF